ncbi:DeoR/GlpR transcriptional regulator [Rahnella aquatilis]|jgi:DeoR/GlpR family transcriptional regulator of sugar metabolism|uniref:DeoR/GlpR family DNA-binding transcription regulator n=1 Tax=Rahnella TaxID=34037 RepID=UPI000DD32C1C|nr:MULTISPECIES: DeoR/GlpR family DNA-binding transcription regulator [Rahnella]AZP44115.1 DeoR/GlpR transcriptional regulator [Rahnella aquatilis]AZP48452.1 DeoR/GlpR transcriptional regulator [Rahnella aquatilis]MBU9839206.1 DeoR/GlpR transcriptional regulator [Rahnella aceris]MDP9702875.1 DeoR/GlpR family transcriptional regulator of sugar metabolism [Rahnella aquatilis]MQB54371.1 DeoR family transcriptional regulator [Rahnella sp. RcJ3]
MSLTELTGNPRHDQLLALIAERGYMNIEELAALLDVSTQTARRDIRKLSDQGLITRHHGGAGRASSVVNTAFEQREISWTEEKKAIAESIADYIPDGSTVFITIGTTVEQVAHSLLNHNRLRIITNCLRVAHILYKNPRFEVMVPGGTLRPHNGGIIGPAATAFVAGFRADYLVTSVGAIESDGALLEFDVNEASVVKTMMAHSRHILLAADHTKFHASAAVEIGNVSQATALFTDELPPAGLLKVLKNHQVEVIKVSTAE